MKVPKVMSLDLEIVTQLKMLAPRVNISNLVETYLRTYLSMERQEYTSNELESEFLTTQARYLELKALKDMEEAKKRAVEEEKARKAQKIQEQIEKDLREGRMIRL